jgi:hypothetical protein
MDGFTTCNARSGNRNTLFNRLSAMNSAGIELRGSNAGSVTDNFGSFDLRRGNLDVNCTGAGNTMNDFFIYGQTAFLNLNGTTGGQTLLTSRIRIFDSSMTYNNVSAQVDTLYVTLHDASNFNLTNIATTGKTFRDIGVSEASTFNATGPYSSAGPDGCSQIKVMSNGIYTHSLAATLADNVTVTSGTIVHNGGALSDVIKTMSGTLTTGNFNHSGIQRHVVGNKTLTAANSALADYQGLAPQLI